MEAMLVCPCGWHKTRLNIDNDSFNASYVCNAKQSHWIGPCCTLNRRCKHHKETRLVPTGTLWSRLVRATYPAIEKGCFGGYVLTRTHYTDYVQQAFEPDAVLPIEVHTKGTYKNPTGVMNAFDVPHTLRLSQQECVITGLARVVYAIDKDSNAAWILYVDQNGLPSKINTVFYAPKDCVSACYGIDVTGAGDDPLTFQWTEHPNTAANRWQPLHARHHPTVSLLPNYELQWRLTKAPLAHSPTAT